MTVSARALCGVWLLTLSAAPLSAQTLSRDTRPAGLATGFGTAIAVAGEEIFVGRSGMTTVLPAPATQNGAVHVFRRDGELWVETATIAPADLEVGDGFGLALAVDGNVLVVGAPARAGARGIAYVFERSGAGVPWTLVARLETSDGAAGDSLGFAVAVHGDVALLGAPGAGTGGAAFVFQREDNGEWAQHHRLEGADLTAGDRFGAALALGEGRVLIGAPGPHPAPSLGGPPPSFRTGSVRVFRHDHNEGEGEGEGAWTEEATLTPADEGVVTFGVGLAFTPRGAFVSAPAANATGVVYQYRLDGTDWRHAATITAADINPQALFGISVAAAGSDLLVGAPFAGGTGSVYVFRATDDAWDQVQQLPFQGSGGLAPFFGAAIGVGEQLAAFGAPGAEFFEGTGTVYRRGADGEWVSEGSIVEAEGGLRSIVGGQVDCEDGAARMFTCEEVDLVSFLPVSAIGGKRGVMVNDVWGWTDEETGKEYAIVGRFDATTFIDLSDPANPVYLGELPLHQGAAPSLWRDIKVYQNHAFIVADGAGPHGMQVFDLTQLRTVTSPPVTFTETAYYDGIFSAHNIVINEETGFAYAVGSSMGGETCGGALHMIDIRDPERPTFAGCYADPLTGNAGTGYTHDAQCVVYRGPDPDYDGREICFNSSETALGIADVTDKERPTPISRATYPGVGYTHQGWISDDQRYFFVNDELDELAGTTERTRTLVWDIEDLDDPVLATEYLGETGATDHNLYVRGRYMYQSNYVSGLRIIDITDPTNPVEVAYFDTVPWGENAPGFAGSWSNYPYFESGVIVVSSMREGVFVLKKRERAPIP